MIWYVCFLALPGALVGGWGPPFSWSDCISPHFRYHMQVDNCPYSFKLNPSSYLNFVCFKTLEIRAWIGRNAFVFATQTSACTISAIFSSPEQCSLRAIVLPPASALASAVLASTNVCFTLKFSGPLYFQTLWWIWFMFGMMIDIGPRFYTVPSLPRYMTLKSWTWTFMFKFYVKV